MIPKKHSMNHQDIDSWAHQIWKIHRSAATTAVDHAAVPCVMRQAAQAKERLRAEAEQEIREAAKAKAEQERLEEEQKAEEERF